MAEKKPFVGEKDRPDLTVKMEGKVGDLTVRELASILGFDPSAAKLKELPATAADKLPLKEIQKDLKDRKDTKEHKDQKEPKDRKDQKDTKDRKDPKEQKDQKDQKERKDQKDPKDTKDQKDQKEPKDEKDQKERKEHKDRKDSKDHKDIKEGLKEVKEGQKEIIDSVPKAVAEPGPGPVGVTPELTALIQRLSGLEQAVEELKKGRK